MVFLVPLLFLSTATPPTIAKADSPVAYAATSSIPHVPFYSQFKDISASRWQKVGCGIASLAMIIDYYDTDPVSVDTLLAQGIASGAYVKSAGWSHQGLVRLSGKYGLTGLPRDFSSLTKDTAIESLKDALSDGPVIASVHYKFDPKSTIPHLVVVTAIKNDTVYVNDPASKTGTSTVSLVQFIKAWKKRIIEIRPKDEQVA